jgi:prolipoprotein diacylglyceryltransferase
LEDSVLVPLNSMVILCLITTNIKIMETLMTINTAHGGMYYSISYLAAILVAAGIAIYAGFSKGYPKIAWLLVLVSGGLFFIIGEKMFSYSAEQWTQVFTRFYFSPTDKKTILGGIVGLFVGLILAKTILKFKQPVLDHFAIALPVAMAISRIGCLMAGCCFGIPTNLPWGINYDAASKVYHAHLSHGLIDLHSNTSLAVHPVQLYQVIGCLIIAIIVWKTRKYWKVTGSMFLFSILSYAVLRFFIEFVRDPDSSFVLVKQYYGIKAIQWVLLAVLLIGILILIFRELNKRKDYSISGTRNIQDFRLVVIISLLCIIAIIGKNWFTKLELLTIIIFLTPVAIAAFVQLYRNNTAPGFRWVAPLVFMGGCMFMAQTTIPDEKNKDKTKFTELGFSGTLGKYYENVGKINSVWVPGHYIDDCDGTHWVDGYNDISLEPIGKEARSFYQGRMDLSHNKWVGEYYKFSIGTSLFVGSESGDNMADDINKTSFGISPFVSWDWRWIGIGTGFSLGQMKIKNRDFNSNSDNYSNGEIVSYDYKNGAFFPSLNLRFGPYDILFAEAKFPALFPSSSVFPMFQTAIGSGFGKTNGTKATIGYCFEGLYSELVYPIKNKTVLKLYYANNLSSGQNSKSVLSVGINFRFFSKKNNAEK